MLNLTEQNKHTRGVASHCSCLAQTSAVLRTLPGRCDQLLQQSVSGDQRCLSVDGSCLVPELVPATRRELVTGGDASGGDAVLAKVLSHNNNNTGNSSTWTCNYKREFAMKKKNTSEGNRVPQRARSPANANAIIQC